jgi:peptidoglycan/LPS O-acetylase OafA/YrhL
MTALVMHRQRTQSASWTGTLDPSAPNAFTLLRFLAATLVVIGHTDPILGRPERSFLGESYGAIAVDVFFVMSGYLIASAWQRRSSVWQYARNRALRIVPGYAGVVALSVFLLGPLLTTLPLETYWQSETTWGYLANPTFTTMRFDLPGVFTSLPQAMIVNGSLWTLPIEAAMYVLLPVLGIVGLLRRRRLVLVLAALALVKYFAEGHLIAHEVSILGIMPAAAALGFAIFFLLGALAWLWTDALVLRGDVAAGLWLLVWILQPSAAGKAVFAVAIAYTVLLAARCPWRWATRFGQRRDLSYGLYLYAFPIQQCVVLAAGRDVPLALHLGVSWLLAVGFAALSWRWIESPALTLKGRAPRTVDAHASVDNPSTLGFRRHVPPSNGSRPAEDQVQPHQQQPAGAVVDPVPGPAPADVIAARTWQAAGDLAARFRGAKPFPHVVIDGFLDDAFCRRIVGEFPAYDAERFRNEWGESGKAHHERIPQIGPAFRALHETMRSPAFLDFMSRLSSIPNLLFDPEYFGGGTHENLHGMELDPHIDFNLHPTSKLHRRLNFLLYLNDDWCDDWGGALELHTNPWLDPSRDEVLSISPALNRCVIFETSDHSWHGFRRLDLPASERHRSRRSFALYLYTRERPDGPLIPHDITIYTDRPLPERIRTGRTLDDDDVRELQTLLARRDRKLEYLYGRAIDYAQPTLRGEPPRVREPHANAAEHALPIRSRYEAVEDVVVGTMRRMRDLTRDARDWMRSRNGA